jgi:hypothetical protein
MSIESRQSPALLKLGDGAELVEQAPVPRWGWEVATPYQPPSHDTNGEA